MLMNELFRKCGAAACIAGYFEILLRSFHKRSDVCDDLKCITFKTSTPEAAELIPLEDEPGSGIVLILKRQPCPSSCTQGLAVSNCKVGILISCMRSAALPSRAF